MGESDMAINEGIRARKDNRRVERRKALNVLYHLEMMDEIYDVKDLEELIREYEMPVESFAAELVRLTLNNISAIDEALSRFIESYRWEALPPLERSLLRLGAAQVMFGRAIDVPVEVAINETVEMAKTYSYRNFYKFANAILDKIAKSSDVLESDTDAEGRAEGEEAAEET